MKQITQTYGLWKFLNSVVCNPKNKHLPTYKHVLNHFILSQLSNLKDLKSKQTLTEDGGYYFFETTIPKNNLAIIDGNTLDMFLKITRQDINFKYEVSPIGKKLIGLIAGYQGETGILDFNPKKNLSDEIANGYFGQFEGAPNDLHEIYLKGIGWGEM